MLDKQIIQLGNLNSDEEYKVTRVKRVKKPSFTMTGNGMKSLDIIADFNKPEAFTFKELKNNRDWASNIVEYSTWHLTPTQKVVFSKGYKVLDKLGLVTRIRKGKPSIYMFNPAFIIPTEYEEARVKWLEVN